MKLFQWIRAAFKCTHCIFGRRKNRKSSEKMSCGHWKKYVL